MNKLNTVLIFIKVLPKKYAKFGPKIHLTTKHVMFRATNLCQSREFYFNAVMLETFRRYVKNKF